VRWLGVSVGLVGSVGRGHKRGWLAGRVGWLVAVLNGLTALLGACGSIGPVALVGLVSLWLG
jgi:hypothetical protein